MVGNAKRDFDSWIKNFRNSVATWDYYVDFEKVYQNVNSIKVELNLLNSLIGSDDIENEFRSLVEEYPKVMKAIPILIAKREFEIKVNDCNSDYVFDFKKMNYSVNEYCLFMENTGLFNLLQNHIVKDLTDYVKGIEVGMDTNARKNRTGHIMEDLVESFIVKSGFIKNISYFKEMRKSDIEKVFSIDLSSISNNGKSEKRFDFVICANNCIYAIEANFYSGGGSKLNETARSYEMLARQAKNIEGFRFIWFTDGHGWNLAKNNLRQTFEVLDDVYSIDDLENDILKTIVK